MKLLVDSRYNTTIILPTHQPVDNNRNLIIRDFLVGSYDYLLMIDSDNPPMNNPIDLVELDKDVMVLPTPQWNLTSKDLSLGRYPIFWNCMDEVEGGWKEHNPKKGLQEIDGAGSGCILISRKVLEKVKIPFERKWDEDGIVVEGSDFNFCRKVRDLGFKVWCHYDYPCRHFKEMELTEIVKAFMGRDVCSLGENINTKEYWDKEWSKRISRTYPYYKRITELTKGKRVLDFGCGRGDLMEMLDHPFGIDISERAIEIIKGRSFSGHVGTQPEGKWDVIVCTQVLEHLDDDRKMLDKFFNHTDYVIYAVPNNCLPPGVEKEHRRVYTRKYIEQITPYLKKITEFGDYLLVEASKNGSN